MHTPAHRPTDVVGPREFTTPGNRRSYPTALRLRAILAAIAALTIATLAHAGYVTQSYIDSTVQRAYFLMGEADDGLHSPAARRQVIANAKSVAERLRALAEKDPNRNYILSKAAELESQIRLEEEAVADEQGRGKVGSLNALVADFNKEVGKRLPDFGALKAIERQVQCLNPAKSEEMANNILQRVANVSGTLVRMVQEQIEDGAYDSARVELAYVKSQQKHLWISLTQYGKLEARLQAATTVDGEIRFVTKAMNRADSLAAVNALGKAWGLVRTVDARLVAIKAAIRTQEWDRHHFRNRRLERTLVRREDSLVAVALSILKSKGEVPASEYCAEILKPMGMSSEKMAKVNGSIIASAAATPQTTSPEVKAEVAALTQDGSSLSRDLRLAAKARARSYAGNAPSENPPAPEPVTQLDRIRTTNLEVAASNARQRSREQRNWRTEKAQRTVVEIYKYVNEKDMPGARRLFYDNQTLLKLSLSSDGYASLDSALAR